MGRCPHREPRPVPAVAAPTKTAPVASRGGAVQTVMLCEVVAHNAQAGLLSQLFGLYLDEADQPLPELLAFALPGPLSALGQHAAVQLCPLFHARSALNSGAAYLQPAASSPLGAGQAVALRFEEVVMRNPPVCPWSTTTEVC